MLGREHAHGAGRLRGFTDGLGPGMVRNCDSQPQGPEHKAFLRGTPCCGVPRVCRSGRSPPDLAGEREIARRSGSVAGQPAGVAARVLRRLTLSTSARSRDCTRSTACLPSRPANTCCARSRWLRTRTMPPRCTRPQRPRTRDKTDENAMTTAPDSVDTDRTATRRSVNRAVWTRPGGPFTVAGSFCIDLREDPCGEASLAGDARCDGQFKRTLPGGSHSTF